MLRTVCSLFPNRNTCLFTYNIHGSQAINTRGSISHHQANLFPGGQPLQKLTSQLETQDAGLAQAALQGLLIFLAGVRAPPRSLEYIVDDAHDILPKAAV